VRISVSSIAIRFMGCIIRGSGVMGQVSCQAPARESNSFRIGEKINREGAKTAKDIRTK
jgi:hypothetical protein